MINFFFHDIYKIGRIRFAILPLAVLMVVFDLVGVNLVIPLIDEDYRETFFDNISKYYEITDYSLSTNIISAFLVAIFLAKGIVIFGYHALSGYLRRKFIQQTRMQLVSLFETIDYISLSKWSSGDLVNYANEQVSRSQQALYFTIFEILCISSLFLYASVFCFIYFDYTILLLIIFCLIYPFYVIFSNKVKILSTETAEINSKIATKVIYYVKNITNMKFNPNKLFSDQLKSDIKQHADIQLKLSFVQSGYASIREPATIIVVGALIIFTVTYQGKNLVSVVPILYLTYRILSYATQLAGIMNLRNEYQGSFYMLKDFLDQSLDLHEKIEYKPIEGRPSLELKNVSFQVHKDAPKNRE